MCVWRGSRSELKDDPNYKRVFRVGVRAGAGYFGLNGLR